MKFREVINVTPGQNIKIKIGHNSEPGNDDTYFGNTLIAYGALYDPLHDYQGTYEDIEWFKTHIIDYTRNHDGSVHLGNRFTRFSDNNKSIKISQSLTYNQSKFADIFLSNFKQNRYKGYDDTTITNITNRLRQYPIGVPGTITHYLPDYNIENVYKVALNHYKLDTDFTLHYENNIYLSSTGNTSYTKRTIPHSEGVYWVTENDNTDYIHNDKVYSTANNNTLYNNNYLFDIKKKKREYNISNNSKNNAPICKNRYNFELLNKINTNFTSI